jgi:hypothetical protein
MTTSKLGLGEQLRFPKDHIPQYRRIELPQITVPFEITVIPLSVTRNRLRSSTAS